MQTQSLGMQKHSTGIQRHLTIVVFVPSATGTPSTYKAVSTLSASRQWFQWWQCRQLMTYDSNLECSSQNQVVSSILFSCKLPTRQATFTDLCLTSSCLLKQSACSIRVSSLEQYAQKVWHETAKVTPRVELNLKFEFKFKLKFKFKFKTQLASRTQSSSNSSEQAIWEWLIGSLVYTLESAYVTSVMMCCSACLTIDPGKCQACSVGHIPSF